MKTLNLVKLFGVSSCCLMLAISVAKADAVALSDVDLDRVTAGQLTTPPPLITLSAPFQGQFATLPGLFDPPPPPPPPPPPDAPPPTLPGAGGLPGQLLSTLVQLILDGGLR